MIKVLFVCMGNICRSPTAEGVFRKLVAEAGLGGRITTDSAGTHAYHIGEPPDSRAMEASARRGIDIGDLRGRQASARDFREFDYILAMDRDNLIHLQACCPAGYEARLRLFMEFAPGRRETEVPDPYFGGEAGFDRVLDMIEDAAAGLLAEIRGTL